MSSSNKGKAKAIDYLFEDPPLTNQKFALISIVGPNMPQKCDVWGLKIRGVASSIEEAKKLSQRILRVDNNYDIYTVDVGKFFPLAIDPLEVNDIEYQNEQLNTLIKSYLENKETANEFWHKRKTEMIQEAIREGKNQEELVNKPEHPIAVLQRIKNYETSITEMEENLESLKQDLERSRDKFKSYSEEERQLAQKEFQKAVESNTDIKVENQQTEKSVEEIRNQLLNDFNLNQSSTNIDNSHDVESILEKIKHLEIELEEMISFKNSIVSTSAPIAYKRVEKNIEDIEKELSNLKTRLNNKELVNSYINENYENPQILL